MITGCRAITDFCVGRVYRLVAGPQHQPSWHNDMNDPLREVGFSMNLSTDVFRGGTFELRDRRTLTPLAQVNNTGFGRCTPLPHFERAAASRDRGGGLSGQNRVRGMVPCDRQNIFC
jgi:hypothetical protein